MELDICWTVAAEQDPVAYFNRYPGPVSARPREGLVEGRDSRRAPYAGALGPGTKFTGQMTSVGAGSIDWKRIFGQADKAGIKHYIVEYDNPKSPLDDLARRATRI